MFLLASKRGSTCWYPAPKKQTANERTNHENTDPNKADHSRTSTQTIGVCYEAPKILECKVRQPKRGQCLKLCVQAQIGKTHGNEVCVLGFAFRDPIADFSLAAAILRPGCHGVTHLSCKHFCRGSCAGGLLGPPVERVGVKFQCRFYLHVYLKYFPLVCKKNNNKYDCIFVPYLARDFALNMISCRFHTTQGGVPLAFHAKATQKGDPKSGLWPYYLGNPHKTWRMTELLHPLQKQG